MNFGLDCMLDLNNNIDEWTQIKIKMILPSKAKHEIKLNIVYSWNWETKKEVWLIYIF